MIEQPIRKPNNFLSKTLKMMSFFLIVTLCSFFGCVQIFKPSVPDKLPEQPAGATMEPYQQFFSAMMGFKSIDTNFRLGMDSNAEDMSLFVDGNVVYAEDGKLSLDIDLIYNEQSFNVDAKYLAPDLYLAITPEGSEIKKTYKFDTSVQGADGEFDFAGLVDFISDILGIELDLNEKLNELVSSLGIDLDNFDFKQIIKKQQEREDGTFEFVLGLGTLSVQVICDEKYNIKTAVLRDATVNSIDVTFNATVNNMNNLNVKVEHQESGDEIDMSGLAIYTGYAQNLLGNDFVEGDVKLALQDKTYDAKLYVDNSNETKIKLETNVEGFDIALAYQNDIVYLDVSGLKFSFDVEDYPEWEAKIEELVAKHTDKTVSELVNELIEKYLGIDVENLDVQKSLMGILSGAFTNIDAVNEYLPNETYFNEEDKSFSMTWDSGINVLLTQENNNLKTVKVESEVFDLDAEFRLVDFGFAIEGVYFDITRLMPLTDVVNEILLAKQFGGNLEVEIGGNTISAKYVVDFKNKLVAKVDTTLFGETVEIYLNDNQIFLVAGELVVEGCLSDIESYIGRIEEIFGVELVDESVQMPEIDEMLREISNVLKQLSVGEDLEKLAVISYLTTLGAISVDGDVAYFDVVMDDMKANAEIAPTAEMIVLPTSAEHIDGILNKVENVKTYVEGNKYAFDFSVVVGEEDEATEENEVVTIAGSVQIDLENNIYEVSGVKVGGYALAIRYAGDVAYIDYAGSKLKVKASSVEEIVKIVMAIVEANSETEETPEEAEISAETDDTTKLILEIFGEDVRELSIKEALERMVLKITGTTANLGLNVIYTSKTEEKVVRTANVAVKFAGDDLSGAEVVVDNKLILDLTRKTLNFAELATEKYYDLTTAQKGTLTFVYTYKEEQADGTTADKTLDIKADVELDLSDKVYLRVQATVLGEEIEIVLNNDKVLVRIGTINLVGDLNDAKGLYEEILATFGLGVAEVSATEGEATGFKLDLNAIDVKKISGLTWSVTADGLSVTYDLASDMKLSLALDDNQTVTAKTIPETAEDLETLLPKVKNVMDMIQSQQFAFEFVANYKGTEISGFAQVDLKEEIYEVSGLMLGGSELAVRYENSMLYVNYGGNMFKVAVDDGMTLVEIVMAIVNQNLATEDTDSKEQTDAIEEMLVKIFGEDVRTFTLEELIAALTLDISGTTNKMLLTLTTNTEKTVVAKVGMTFASGNLSGLSMNVNEEISLGLTMHKFNLTKLDETSEAKYYNLMSAHKGTVTLNMTTDEIDEAGEAVVETITANLELDLVDRVFAKATITVLGEKVEVIVLNNMLYVTAGELAFSTNFNSAKELYEYVLQVFAVAVPAAAENTEGLSNADVFANLDFNAINVLEMFETFTITNEELELTYALNDKMTISVSLKDEQTLSVTTIPAKTEDLKTAFIPKVKNTMDYVEGNKYAFDFNVAVGEEDEATEENEVVTIAGSVQIDLENNIYEVSGVKVGGYALAIRYAGDVAYIDYAGSKLKVKASSVEEIVKIVMAIVEANSETEETPEEAEISAETDDTTKLILEIFGEDVRELSIKEALERMVLKITGTTANLGLNVIYTSKTEEKVVRTANVAVKFAGDDLSGAEVVVDNKLILDLTRKTLNFAELATEKYYDLTTAQKGTLTFVYTYKEEQADGTTADKTLDIKADVELDLSDKVYLRVQATVLGEEIEIVLNNDKVLVRIGTINLVGDLNDAKGLYEEILATFGLGVAEVSATEGEATGFKLDLNAIDVKKISGLTWSVTADGLSVTYDLASDMKLSLALDDNQTVTAKTIPETAEDLETLLPKVKNVMDIVEGGVYEFGFTASYNKVTQIIDNVETVVYDGFEVSGVLKFLNGKFGLSDIEISNLIVCGEYLNIRLHENVLYLDYGNMKIKTALTSGESGEPVDVMNVLKQLLNDEFGIDLQFGVFEELLTIATTYTLEDYFKKIDLDIIGTSDAIAIAISKINGLTKSSIANVAITFENDKLNKVDFNLYGLLDVNMSVSDTGVSTIAPFDETKYNDSYKDDFLTGMMNSLEVEENVYALSSDIAIRYSTTTFYGELTAMLVEDESYNGMLGHYMPAISIHTTSLGLNSYIYLIGETLYIDIQGLQIKADLNQTTIDEVMSFVEDTLGISLSQGTEESAEATTQAEALEATTEAFKVIIPAIDKFYGNWVSDVESGTKGVLLEMKDSLWYSDSSRFYDIVLKAMLKNYQDAIIPTEFVLGANIQDLNTSVYEDGYGDYLLKDETGVVMEEAFSHALNFAVYMDITSVGKNLTTLDATFVKDVANDETYLNFSSVASNYGTTKLADFNPYTTVLEMVETVYGYAFNEGLEYQAGIDVEIANGTNVTSLGGDAIVDLVELNETQIADKSIFKLFGDKAMKVQGDFSLASKTRVDGVDTTLNKHNIDIFYDSVAADAAYAPGIYATYIHSNYEDDDKVPELNNNLEHVDADGNAAPQYFRGKIANGNLSDIISMVAALMQIDLGEEMKESLSLTPPTTDFAYIQSLMKTEETDVGDDLSKVDGILASIEKMTKMLNKLKLEQKLIEGSTTLHETILTITLDMISFNNPDYVAVEGEAEEHQLGTVSIKLIDEENGIDENGNVIGVQKLRQIVISGLQVGEDVISATINIQDFDAVNFDYFTKNPDSAHVDLSTISDFVDTAVTTVNTQHFNFAGDINATIDLSIGEIELNMTTDIYATIDDEGTIYAYAQFITVADSLAELAYKNSILEVFSNPFDERVSIMEFVGDKTSPTLTISRYDIKDSSSGLFNKKYWTTVSQSLAPKTYTGAEQISSNLSTIIKDLFGFGDLLYPTILDLIGNIESHPTIERAIKGYSKTTNGYDVTVNGKNLLGVDGAKDMTLTIGQKTISADYKSILTSVNEEGTESYSLSSTTKGYNFIDSIYTVMNISDMVLLTLDLKSVSGDSYQFYDRVISIASPKSDFRDSGLLPRKAVNTNQYYRNAYISAYNNRITTEYQNLVA